VLTSCAVECEF